MCKNASFSLFLLIFYRKSALLKGNHRWKIWLRFPAGSEEPISLACCEAGKLATQLHIKSPHGRRKSMRFAPLLSRRVTPAPMRKHGVMLRSVTETRRLIESIQRGEACQCVSRARPATLQRRCSDRAEPARWAAMSGHNAAFAAQLRAQMATPV